MLSVEISNGMESEMKEEIVESALSESYEVSYLITATKSAEDAEKIVEVFKASILKKGGVISYEGKTKVIDLAYPMSQVIRNKRQVHRSAYFGWLLFQIERSSVFDIKHEFDENSDVIRFLIIKTKKETREVRLRPIRKPVLIKKDDTTPAVSLDEAKLDKELEEMLTV